MEFRTEKAVNKNSNLSEVTSTWLKRESFFFTVSNSQIDKISM